MTFAGLPCKPTRAIVLFKPDPSLSRLGLIPVRLCGTRGCVEKAHVVAGSVKFKRAVEQVRKGTL